MATKTNKELQTENSDLTFKLKNLKENFDKLSVEHKILPTQLISEKEKTNKKCNNCIKNLENVTNTKKLRNDPKSKTIVFKCDQCEKEFYDEWNFEKWERSFAN